MKLIVTDRDGVTHEIDGKPGLSVMEVLQDIGMIEGECGGSLACATCHVWVDPAWADKFDPPSDGEEDMLDCAFDITETSRLGCQLMCAEELDGLAVRLPG